MSVSARNTQIHTALQRKSWVATARPIDDTGVLVAMRTEGELPEGPWSFVTDYPSGHRAMLGPPPIYLALAGWATIWQGYRVNRRCGRISYRNCGYACTELGKFSKVSGLCSGNNPRLLSPRD